MTEDSTNPQDWNGTADLLDRKSEADFLSKYLLSRVQNKQEDDENPAFVLNIDAAWGAGKTYMLKNWAKDLEAQGHWVAYVNAWENDHEEDALASIILEVENCVIKHEPQKAASKRESWTKVRDIGMRVAVASVKSFAKTQLRRHIGEVNLGNTISDGADTLFDQMGHWAFEKIKEDRDSKLEFREALGEFVVKLGTSSDEDRSLFIFIDELDRCRPTYAIEMLERVKHLFSVPKIGFVVATDTSQLQHSIKAIYGNEFDSSSYLSRFFDRSYQLRTPLKADFVSHCIKALDIDLSLLEAPMNEDSLHFLQRYFEEPGIELRDIQRCLRILGDVITTWDHNCNLQLTFMMPLVVAYQKGNNSTFLKLKNLNPNVDFIGSNLSFEIQPRPPYDSSGILRPKQTVTLKEVLSTFASVHQRSLEEASNITEYDQIWSWASDQARLEFSALHQGAYFPGTNLPSIALGYGELVKHAGSLRPELPNTKTTP